MKNILAALLSLVMLTTLLSGIAGITVSADPAVDSTNDDYIHAVGSKFYDMYGNEVRLTGANWFGFNCSERILHGLWSADMRRTLKAIADHGINLLRMPISTEIIYEWSTGNAVTPQQIQINEWNDVNVELEGMNSLQMFDRMVEICKEYGIKIMVDIHSAKADNLGHNYPVWYNEMSSGKFCDTKLWIDMWVWLVNRYKNDDTIIACDLKNEPHGKPGESPMAKWDGSTDVNNWAYAATECAKAILDVNPNLLIMVEGVEAYPNEGVTYASTDKSKYFIGWWGGILTGARDYPIDVGPELQSQIVYSPHDYGPKVFAQTWFAKDFTKETLMNDYWYKAWAYLVEEDIAPILIGEWGGFMDGGDNEKWLNLLAQYIAEKGLSHTFWCVNANSSDTGGLLDYDFVTWDEARYAVLKPTLWQNGAGKFIGLDHEIPLGDNSILIGDYYDENGNPINPPKPVDSDSDTDKESDTDTVSDTDSSTDTDKPTDSDKPTDTDKPDVFKLGDVNSDSILDIVDVVLTRSHIVGNRLLNEIDENAPTRSDMNRDKNVDIIDVVMMRSVIVFK